MSQSIPIILAGKSPSHRAAVIKILQPDFEVVKECTNVEEIKEYLGAMTPSDQPAAILIGGGYSPPEFEEARAAPGAEKLAWLRADASKGRVTVPGGGYPSAEAVAERARKGCDDHIDELSQRKGAGEVWLF